MFIGQLYLEELNDYQAAIKHFEDLHDKYPYISDFLYSLVQAYAKSEKKEDAISVLESWLFSHPNDSQAIEWLSILDSSRIQ